MNNNIHILKAQLLAEIKETHGSLLNSYKILQDSHQDVYIKINEMERAVKDGIVQKFKRDIECT